MSYGDTMVRDGIDIAWLTSLAYAVYVPYAYVVPLN